MINHSEPPRLLVKAALLLTPDDRPQTRRAIMRAAVLSCRTGQTKMPRIVRKRMTRGMSKGQQIWVGLGVGLFQLFYFKPALFCVFALTGAWMVIKFALAIIRMVGA